MADISTDIDMPPVLEDALTFTLSERLCIPFRLKVSDELREQAHGARQIYRQINESDPVLIGTALLGTNGTVDNYWFQSRGHQ
jgi:DNA recombination-dependent growth factor C